jgi:hypothetical protein
MDEPADQWDTGKNLLEQENANRCKIVLASRK